MMKHEFERLAGYEVSAEDYNKIIEPMYMATDLSKAEFVKVIDKKRFALKSLTKMRNEMTMIARGLEDSCTHYVDFEAEDKLEALANEYKNRIGATGWTTNEAMKWTCYYPTSIDFYDCNYHTIETVRFF